MNFNKLQLEPDTTHSIFLRGAFGSFFAKVSGAALLFGAQIVLARALGATEYGFYAYALSWMTILSIPAKFGFETSLLRFLPEYSVNNQWSLFRGAVKFSILTVTFASLILAFTGMALISLFVERIPVGLLVPMRLMLITLPLFALTAIRQSCLRGLKYVVLAELPEGVIRPLVLSGFVLIVSDSVGSFDAGWAWIGQFFAVLIAFLIGTVMLLKKLPGEMSGVPPLYRKKEWTKVSAPMLMMNSMNIIMSQAAIVILGFYQPAEEIALFSASARIVILATFALLAINSIAAPLISEKYHSGQVRELQSLLGLAAKVIALVSLVAACVLLLGGRWILGWFGNDFSRAYPVMLILLAGFMVKSFAGPASFLLNLTGHQNTTAKAMAGAVAVSLVLHFMLIAVWGIYGAAIASAATMILWNLTLVVLNRLKLGLDPSIFALARREKNR